MRQSAMSEELLNLLPTSATVYLHKVELSREAALLTQLDHDGYRAASFLDDRILTSGTTGAWVPLACVAQLAHAVRKPQPLHYIFHTGHVGSTLISRLLDESGVVLSLREPLPLRTLAEAADVLGQVDSLLSPAQFETLRFTLAQLWSRGYESTQAVVVKATSSAGRIAQSLLKANSASRAIYLNIDVEPYLATLLAGKNSAIDLRGHGPGRIRRVQARISTPLAPLHTLSLGELTAMSWLAETWNQQQAAKQGGVRVLSIDFEHFLRDLELSMERILTHFDLPRESRFLSTLTSNPVLTRYSKATQFAYSPQIRAQQLDESRQTNREEIRRGLAWIENLAKLEPAVSAVLS